MGPLSPRLVSIIGNLVLKTLFQKGQFRGLLHVNISICDPLALAHCTDQANWTDFVYFVLTLQKNKRVKL